MGLLGKVKKKIVVKLAIREGVSFIRQALAGKKGPKVKKFFEGVQGLRSAIMLVLVVVELLAKQFGFEAGPLFAILNGIMSTFGWEKGEAIREVGIDPAIVATALASLYFAARRAVTWYRERKAVQA